MNVDKVRLNRKKAAVETERKTATEMQNRQRWCGFAQQQPTARNLGQNSQGTRPALNSLAQKETCASGSPGCWVATGHDLYGLCVVG